VTAYQVEDVVVAALEATPRNATHWSRSKMASRSGSSESTIVRIWKAFGLHPHRAQGMKRSNDPLFVEKVHDVVGMYLNPPEAAVVLCVDETGQVQALARSSRRFRAVPPALHPDLLVAAEPGGAVVRPRGSRSAAKAATTTALKPSKPTNGLGPDRNENPKPVACTKTADQILASPGRLLQRIPDAGH
jgi:hypothetical protein